MIVTAEELLDCKPHLCGHDHASCTSLEHDDYPTFVTRAVGMVMSSMSLAISGRSSGSAIVSRPSSTLSATMMALYPACSALKAFSTK